VKLGAKPKPIWHNPSDLNKKYNRLSSQINRLMVLDYAWKKVTAGKEKFWKISAVQKRTILVEVKLSVARNELVARREMIIKELNKYFDRPWIEKIEIVKPLGAIHE
jgi:hypothetical protein